MRIRRGGGGGEGGGKEGEGLCLRPFSKLLVLRSGEQVYLRRGDAHHSDAHIRGSFQCMMHLRMASV